MLQYEREKIIDMIHGADKEEKELMLQELLKDICKNKNPSSIIIIDKDDGTRYNITRTLYHG